MADYSKYEDVIDRLPRGVSPAVIPKNRKNLEGSAVNSQILALKKMLAQLPLVKNTFYRDPDARDIAENEN
jgi:hypothetical protein